MKLRCRLGRHRWVLDPAGPSFSCRDCGKTHPMRKTFFCYLGIHDWATFQRDGEKYLACRRCLKYGGDPGRAIGSWKYHD